MGFSGKRTTVASNTTPNPTNNAEVPPVLQMPPSEWADDDCKMKVDHCHQLGMKETRAKASSELVCIPASRCGRKSWRLRNDCILFFEGHARIIEPRANGKENVKQERKALAKRKRKDLNGKQKKRRKRRKEDKREANQEKRGK